MTLDLDPNVDQDIAKPIWAGRPCCPVMTRVCVCPVNRHMSWYHFANLFFSPMLVPLTIALLWSLSPAFTWCSLAAVNCLWINNVNAKERAPIEVCPLTLRTSPEASNRYVQKDEDIKYWRRYRFNKMYMRFTLLSPSLMVSLASRWSSWAILRMSSRWS